MQEEYKLIKLIRSFFFVSILTLLISTVLLSFPAFADDPSVVDDINITVPVSCSLSGTGMDTHITSLHNTESDSSIGESTITAYCNDINGFSIYAVGFTNNEYGNNYLIDSNLPSTTNIATGTATSGNTSQWAMKLSPITNTNPSPTYPIIVTGTTEDTDKTPTTLNYTSFQPVPNEYTLVAKRKAATDVGTNAEGSSFKTTYQAYISPTQNAGTYTGQVRYTLVHPYNHAVPDPPSFKVLYTGRPISTEPGNENPVTVLMSDLPQDGKYNLLGTTSGQYDKLTPNTLYGGYYKYEGDSDEYEQFINNYEVYNGRNYYMRDIVHNGARVANAANFEPEEDAIYLVKEVPNNTYLQPFIQSGLTGGVIVSQYFVTNTDDKYYRETGFEVRDVINDNMVRRAGKLAKSLKLTYESGIVVTLVPTTVNTDANGENNDISYWSDVDGTYLVENGIIELIQYWVTPDYYRVTGNNKMTVEYNNLRYANIAKSFTSVPVTMTYIGE